MVKRRHVFCLTLLLSVAVGDEIQSITGLSFVSPKCKIPHGSQFLITLIARLTIQATYNGFIAPTPPPH